MTYCLGMVMREGLVMASDSRSNASLDDVNVCQKMHTIVDPGERVFILLTSGNLSCSQSIVTLLRRDFDQGMGLASASSMYDAARVVGQQVRSVADMDQPDLNKHNFRFNVHLLMAGQIRGQPHDLYLIYPQGNPLRDGGRPVPPDRRVQVRPPHPRLGSPLRELVSGGRCAVCPDFTRFDDALERGGRPAARPLGLRPRRVADHPPAAVHRPRSGSPGDPDPVGAVAPQGGPGVATSSVRRARYELLIAPPARPKSLGQGE